MNDELKKKLEDFLRAWYKDEQRTAIEKMKAGPTKYQDDLTIPFHENYFVEHFMFRFDDLVNDFIEDQVDREQGTQEAEYWDSLHRDCKNPDCECHKI